MLIGWKLPQSTLSFPSFDMNKIIASLQEGGFSLFCSNQLQALNNVGANCSHNDLYHSVMKPFVPGNLFAFSFEIAECNSCILHFVNP